MSINNTAEHQLFKISINFLILFLASCTGFTENTAIVEIETATEKKKMKEISTEDQLAIHELIAKYSHFIDAGEAQAWSKLFTEDAKLITPVGNADGKEAIFLWAKTRIDRRDPGLQMRHFVVNTLLHKVDEKTVNARSMLLLTIQNRNKENSAEILGTSIYEDTLSKIIDSNGHSRWLFSKRETDIHLPIKPSSLSLD